MPQQVVSDSAHDGLNSAGVTVELIKFCVLKKLLAIFS